MVNKDEYNSVCRAAISTQRSVLKNSLAMAEGMAAASAIYCLCASLDSRTE